MKSQLKFVWTGRFTAAWLLRGSLLYVLFVFFAGCTMRSTDQQDSTALLALLALPAAAGTPTHAYFSNGQSASKVIGQSGFAASTANQGGAAAANTLSAPIGLLVVGSRLYVVDNGNHRILGFNSVPVANNAGADFVVGQTDLNGQVGGSTAQKLNSPRGITAGGSVFAVADRSNRRVQIFNSTPTVSGPAADVAIGASSTAAVGTATCTAKDLNNPESVFVAGGKVVVVDSSNNRVLIWNSIPSASYADADVVLGQSTKVSCGAVAASANSLNFPVGAWSDGTRLLVADRLNSRVLLWNTFPTSDGQPADLVLGQASLTTSTASVGSDKLSQPMAIYSNGNQIFVADGGNHRVLIWNSFPATSGVSADNVLGQADLSSQGANNGGIGAATLSTPNGMILSGTRLLVSDFGNHRVLLYEGSASR